MGVKNAKNLEEAFKQVAEYLTLAGENWIVLNSDKFCFGEDWAGIRLTEDKVQPLPEHVRAIRDFPTPTNITDMRSYWALVNQVSPYYSVQPQLQPFRELMKKSSKWYWDKVLQKLFEESRVNISEAVLEGITRYDKDKWKAVTPDCSKTGLGFFMSQKYCSCKEITPICCVGGWRVCMVGSSFTSPAEANYAPVEGECLGVVNALYKTRYYTQSCDKLVVGVDHKPLLGVLNNKSLESIENPRLMRLKQKTLGWRFQIVHIPGRKLGGPDALSRAVAPGEVHLIGAGGLGSGGRWQPELEEHSNEWDTGTKFSDPNDEENTMTCKDARQGVMASIRSVMGRNHTLPDPEMDVSGFMLASMQIGVKSVSWEMVQAELHKDTEFKDLSDWISGGCIGPPESLPDYLKQYWRVRHDLRLLEEVPMLSDRTVIPRGLRVPVLQTLHSAHQGVLGMGLRAEQAVYWPGFWSDIERVRAECSMCHKIAPSQSNLPPVEPIIPTTHSSMSVWTTCPWMA